MCQFFAIFASGTSDSVPVLKRLLTYIVFALSYLSMGAIGYVPSLDVYGRVMECCGDRSLVPFRYQGQYEDVEAGLYYNRFRYYSPQMGVYISSDPIGLAGNNPTLYGYVGNVNFWLDPFGLYPGANDGNAPQHGGLGHNNRIDTGIVNFRQQRAVNIRKNQQQVDVTGTIVGRNRPDIQYDLDGIHYNIEYDTSYKSSLNHQRVIPANDPSARNTFWVIDKSGNTINGVCTCKCN